MAHQPVERSSTPRRRRDPKATRDRLVRAALELFTTQGYHASTTPQIAERAAVAEGTIYRHFENKEQLLNDLYRAAVRLFTAAVKDSPASAGCRERLRGIAAHWFELADRDPALVKLVFLTPHGKLLDSRSRAAHQELRAALGQVVAAGKSGGAVRPGSVDLWIDVWMAVVVLALEHIATGDWSGQHPNAEQLAHAAWDAIRTPAGS